MLISTLQKPLEHRNDADLKLLMPYVKAVPYFKQNKFKDKELADICQRLRYDIIYKGKNITKHGEHGDKFYIILQGTVSVWLPEANFSS